LTPQHTDSYEELSPLQNEDPVRHHPATVGSHGRIQCCVQATAFRRVPCCIAASTILPGLHERRVTGRAPV
jgi:hypothetical protein